MKDHVAVAKHKDTGMFHALLYQNHPTSSGSDRPMLRLSTKIGRSTRREAIDDMGKSLGPDYLKGVELPNLEDK